MHDCTRMSEPKVNRPEPVARSRGVLASFSIRSFRFQWSADVLSTWGFEMETLILSWYILVETDSALLVALVGALRFSGSLISPMVGVMADRIARRLVMVWLRCVLSLLALAIIIADQGEVLGPPVVLMIAGGAGLLRPAEHVIRNSLIADTVPEYLLANAVGFSRTTSDSARIVGALAGAGLLASVGIGIAYAVIATMYIVAVVLTFGIANYPPRPGVAEAAPLGNLVSGFRYVKHERVILMTMYMALLGNLTAFPLTHGLLPVVARDVYGLGEMGFASMTALIAAGALTGSLLVAVLMRSCKAEPYMLGAMVAWHALVLLFALTPPSVTGWIILAFVGIASSVAMGTMTVSLLHYASPDFRGRVMGVRMLAVYGLPLGLVVAGALIERFGVTATVASYGTIGLILSIWTALRWNELTTARNLVPGDTPTID